MKTYIIALLSAIILYFLQNILYPHGFFNQLMAILIIAGGAYSWVKGLFGRVSFLYKILSCFIVLNIIAAIYSYVVYDHEVLSQLKAILIALLVFFPFYEAGRRNIDIRSILFIFALAFLVVSIFQFFMFDENQYQDGVTHRVNNIGYSFVLSLPLLILSNKKSIAQIPVVLLIVLMVFVSAKRGALLCLVGGMIVYVLYLFNRTKYFNIHLKLLIQLSILALIIGFFIYQAGERTFILSRFDNFLENDSGRSDILLSLYQYWIQNVEPLNLIAGYGFNQTTELIGIAAHNDWVEVIFNYGLLGLTIYCMLLVTVFREYLYYRKTQIYLNYAVCAVLVIWVLKSLTTGVFSGADTFLLSIVLGYASGNQYRLKREAIHNLRNKSSQS